MDTSLGGGSHSLGLSPQTPLMSWGGQSSWNEITLNHVAKKSFSFQLFLILPMMPKRKSQILKYSLTLLISPLAE